MTVDPTLAVPATPLHFPCSGTQERFWFLDRMNPGDPALNVAFRWHVKGTFSAKSFEKAFRGVIARHEVLRTRFVEDGGQPMQEVMDDFRFKLTEIDIRTTPEAEQPARIDQIASEAAAQSFDLTQPCQLRAVLIRLGNDRAVLAITVHHICFDGWSIGVLGREVGTLAAGFEAGVSEPLEELPLQFGDYAMWQQEYFESDAYLAELEPVCDRLRDAPYFEVPPDFPRPLQRSTTCGRLELDLPSEWGERLKSEARSRGMSTFAYGAGVLSAMLSRCADMPEVLIGSQVAGRPEVDLEPLIGVFINNIVMRFPTAPDTTLGDHLDRAGRVVSDALMGQGVPFNKLVEALNPPRDPSRTPLVSVNFILQKVFMETARYGGFELSSAPSHAPGALHDLNFSLIGRSDGWHITLEYNADMFDPATADDLMTMLTASFEASFDDPERKLAQMPAPQVGPDARQEDAQKLGRVESALASHPMVGEAAVVSYARPDGTRAVQAFVTIAGDAPALPLETLPAMLHDHLETVPGPRPDGISLLHHLPRDASGRLIKAWLPVSQAARANARMNTGRAPKGKSVMEVEARLAPVWKEVLGLDDLPHSANFYDMGGHSLLLVRLLARIDAVFGQRISLADIYGNPTLRTLARHLAGETQAAPADDTPQGDWRVTVLSDAGEGVPLIAINNASLTYAISQHLSPARPEMSVNIHDRTRDTALDTSLDFEQIAAKYADAVRSARPHGPYALFGICVHGNLAIEVARQLRDAGEEVAGVILKDVWEPRYAKRVTSDPRTRRRDKMHFLKVRLSMLRRGDMSLATFLGTFRVFRQSSLLRAAVRLGLMEGIRSTDLNAQTEEYVGYLTAARDVHLPRPYDGRVLYPVTRDTPLGKGFDQTIGWGDIVTGPMETHFLKELRHTLKGPIGRADAAEKINNMLGEYDQKGAQANAQ